MVRRKDLKRGGSNRKEGKKLERKKTRMKGKDGIGRK